MSVPARAQHLAATGTITVDATGAHAALRTLIVGTGAASATVTVADRQASPVTVAVIDASAKGYYDFGDCLLSGGFTVVLAGGNADVTVVYV